MRLLILSDSHGNLQYMTQAVERLGPTHVIHLGDHTRDARDLAGRFPMTPLVSVRGNCDYGDDTPEQRLADYGGVRVLMCHGHRHGVKSGLQRYLLAAKESLADVALFGHTHQAYCEEEGGVWLVNPGSCGGYAPTCAVIDIAAGKPSCRIVRLDEEEIL